MSKQRIVVVGNGMVGHKFIDDLVQRDENEQFEVITFSEEPRLAYDRVQLSKYFSGATAQELALTDENYYQAHGVSYVLNEKVTAIDSAERQVITASGRVESYDKLVLATGVIPVCPADPRE